MRRRGNDSWRTEGPYWTARDLEPGWLSCELAALARAFRQRFPLARALARRRMLTLPVTSGGGALAHGALVRLAGTIDLGTDARALATIHAVAEGADLPDFWLRLADGATVAVAAGDAGRSGRLHRLDAWEDRASGAPCDERTAPLDRQSRFRPGHGAEVCGVVVETPDPDQARAWHRELGRGWTLVAGRWPLTIRFTGAAVVTPRAAPT